MPRNFNKYQYETSPRKLEPEYAPKKNNYKGKKSTARKIEKKDIKKASKRVQEEKEKHRKILLHVIFIFSVLNIYN